MEAFRKTLHFPALLDTIKKKTSFMKKLGVYHWKIGKNCKNKNPHSVKI